MNSPIPTANQLMFKYHQCDALGKEDFVLALADHVIRLLHYAQEHGSVATDTRVTCAAELLQEIAN